MENASKALLIAASILIVILLIAFGVRIFNSTSGMNQQTEESMATTEITMFNNKFVAYVGTNKSKAQAKSLLNQVIANNALDNGHVISIGLDQTSTSGISTVEQINKLISGEYLPDRFANKNVFTIAVGYDNKGYINLIKLY